MADWATASLNGFLTRTSVNNAYYLDIYVVLGFASVIATTIRGLFLARGRINASRNMHAGVLLRVLAAPIFWFDVTPLGRILNRFSRGEAFDAVHVEISISHSEVVSSLHVPASIAFTCRCLHA